MGGMALRQCFPGPPMALDGPDASFTAQNRKPKPGQLVTLTTTPIEINAVFV